MAKKIPNLVVACDLTEVSGRAVLLIGTAVTKYFDIKQTKAIDPVINCAEFDKKINGPLNRVPEPNGIFRGICFSIIVKTKPLLKFRKTTSWKQSAKNTYVS